MTSRDRVVLDAFDKRILAALQADATLPVAKVAEMAGLSPTPCWRRIQKLEQAGVIRKRVALLDRRKLNVGVTVFIVFVALSAMVGVAVAASSAAAFR